MIRFRSRDEIREGAACRFEKVQKLELDVLSGSPDVLIDALA